MSQAIAEMFFSGVSQAKVGAITEPLMGLKPSPSTLSRLAHDFDQECETWRTRLLQPYYRVIYLDGVYFPILHEDRRDQTALLVALRVDLNGAKEVSAVHFGGQENRETWEGLLADLKKRGVVEVDLVVSDDDAGLIGAAERAFPNGKRQRCLLHKMRNILATISQRK